MALIQCDQHGSPDGWCFLADQDKHVPSHYCRCKPIRLGLSLSCPVDSHRRRAEEFRKKGVEPVQP